MLIVHATLLVKRKVHHNGDMQGHCAEDSELILEIAERTGGDVIGQG